MSDFPDWHGTTIVSVRKNGRVVVAGDGQVTAGPDGDEIEREEGPPSRQETATVIAGFAGATADAFTLFERLEAKLDRFPGQLTRAAVELAKDWRTDRYLRRLEAMMIVADKDVTLILTGTGDVLEPDARRRRDRIGRQLSRSPPRARWQGSKPTRTPEDDRAHARCRIAAEVCVYTNDQCHCGINRMNVMSLD